MPRTNATDTRWLERHGGQWRVTISVPRDLHKVLGTRLKKPLHTDSLAVANTLKWRVIDELRGKIEQARQAAAGHKDALVREAVMVASYARRATDPEEVAEIEAAILQREAEILGPEVAEHVDPETGRAVPIYDPERANRATWYRQVAGGVFTPITLHHGAYLAQTHVSGRTKEDDLRAIRHLTTWCERNRVAPSLEAITTKVAVRFLDDLRELTGGLDPVTLKKYLNRLSVYWEYLLERHDIEANPWKGRRIKARPKPEHEQERPFTDEEVRKLLTGEAPPKLKDLMLIGALTGARLEVIVDLKVKDCVDGGIRFKAAKKEKRSRDVPIHPDLVEVIARRSRGKRPEDDLFPEWPKPKKEGSVRERSFKASNAFTAYRRERGVEEVVPGHRRSRVNFHSFRRWFMTRAERAGAPKDLIAAIVGHKRGSLALDRYSAGPAWKAANRYIRKIRLPRLDGGPIREERPLNPASAPHRQQAASPGPDAGAGSGATARQQVRKSDQGARGRGKKAARRLETA